MTETGCFQAFPDDRENRFTFVFGEAITIARAGLAPGATTACRPAQAAKLVVETSGLEFA
jgi:hypothetical protein